MFNQNNLIANPRDALNDTPCQGVVFSSMLTSTPNRPRVGIPDPDRHEPAPIVLLLTRGLTVRPGRTHHPARRALGMDSPSAEALE